MDWQSKFGTKKLRKEFEKECKKEADYFLKKWKKFKKSGKVGNGKVKERIRKKLKR